MPPGYDMTRATCVLILAASGVALPAAFTDCQFSHPGSPRLGSKTPKAKKLTKHQKRKRR